MSERPASMDASPHLDPRPSTSSTSAAHAHMWGCSLQPVRVCAMCEQHVSRFCFPCMALPASVFDIFPLTPWPVHTTFRFSNGALPPETRSWQLALALVCVGHTHRSHPQRCCPALPSDMTALHGTARTARTFAPTLHSVTAHVRSCLLQVARRAARSPVSTATTACYSRCAGSASCSTRAR